MFKINNLNLALNAGHACLYIYICYTSNSLQQIKRKYSAMFNIATGHALIYIKELIFNILMKGLSVPVTVFFCFLRDVSFPGSRVASQVFNNNQMCGFVIQGVRPDRVSLAYSNCNAINEAYFHTRSYWAKSKASEWTLNYKSWTKTDWTI